SGSDAEDERRGSVDPESGSGAAAPAEEVAAISARLAELVGDLALTSDEGDEARAELVFVEIINAYTEALKRNGAEPEQVIGAVRDAVQSMPVAGAIDARWLDELAGAAVQHSIRRYFGGAGSAPREREHIRRPTE